LENLAGLCQIFLPSAYLTYLRSRFLSLEKKPFNRLIIFDIDQLTWLSYWCRILLLIDFKNDRRELVTKTTKAIDFEQQLESLEALVASLENGDLSLEDSMESFEQGIKVARECQKALKEAEQKVEILTRQGNELVSDHFISED
jgi:exodeoxyribonuclease VII small subunit